MGVRAFGAEDYVEARELWTRAAEMGDLDAASNLAYMLYNGLGGERDPDGAMVWGLKAAYAGHPEAPLHLALAYLDDNGVPPDPMEALAWAEVARVRAERLNEPGYHERAIVLGGTAAQGLTPEQGSEALARARERLSPAPPVPSSPPPR